MNIWAWGSEVQRKGLACRYEQRVVSITDYIRSGTEVRRRGHSEQVTMSQPQRVREDG